MLIVVAKQFGVSSTVHTATPHVPGAAPWKSLRGSIETLNVPEDLRRRVFDACWALVSTDPPPANQAERVLDLRFGTELTLDALVAAIRQLFAEAGIATLTWDHPPSDPTRPSSPAAAPLIDRLQKLYPDPPSPPSGPSSQH